LTSIGVKPQPGADSFCEAFERSLDKDKGVVLPVSDRLTPVTTQAGRTELRLVATSVRADTSNHDDAAARDFASSAAA
jgi:hypothetical protein